MNTTENLKGGITSETKTTKYKISDKIINESIIQEHYIHIGSKTTICLLMLNDGAEIIGTYSPIDPLMFEILIGKEKAKLDAIKNVENHIKSVIVFQRALDIQMEMQAKRQEELMKEGQKDPNPPSSEPPVK